MRKVKNSNRKIFRLQIKEREQVSKNEKGFNVGKTKKDLQYFQRNCEDTVFVSKIAKFRLKLPYLTLAERFLVQFWHLVMFQGVFIFM